MQSCWTACVARIGAADDAEITMEANPGTVEADRFSGYQRRRQTASPSGAKASAEKLTRLGAHPRPGRGQRRAATLATGLRLRSFNLDLDARPAGSPLEEAWTICARLSPSIRRTCRGIS